MKTSFKLFAVAAVLAVACQKSEVGVASVSLDRPAIEIGVGESATLIATVLPEDASNKTVSWKSDNESIATVNGGIVTAVAPGLAKITVTTEDGGKTAACVITVVSGAVGVSSVSLDKQELTLGVGDSMTLVATVFPDNAPNKAVTWKSSDEKVAKVVDGVVTAIASGSAVITVTTVEGSKTAICNVAVGSVSGISFVSVPETVVIDHTLSLYEEIATLSWEAVDCTVSEYVLKVCGTEDMKDAYESSVGTLTEISFDTKTINHLASLAGVVPGKQSDVYVQVADKSGNAAPATAKVSVKTEFGSFADPRDNEIYPTVEVGDFTWMCENLRATTYSDGTPLYTNVDGNYTISAFCEDGAFGRRAGMYYCFANAVRDMYDIYWDNDYTVYNANIQVQGVCPDGWHVTARKDWEYMIDEALALTGESMPSGFWDGFWVNGSIEAFNKLVLGKDVEYMGNRGTNDLGLYFLPAGYFQNPSSPESFSCDSSAEGSYFDQICTFNATMRDWWSSLTITIRPQADAPAAIWSNNTGLNPTWSHSVPVRCVKNY